MLELEITLEENDIQEDKTSDLQINDLNPILSENNNAEEKKEIIKEGQEKPLSNKIENEDIESIESIPFISKAPKKKTARVKKIPV